MKSRLRYWRSLAWCKDGHCDRRITSRCDRTEIQNQYAVECFTADLHRAGRLAEELWSKDSSHENTGDRGRRAQSPVRPAIAEALRQLDTSPPGPTFNAKAHDKEASSQECPRFNLSSEPQRVTGMDLTRIDGIDVMVAQTLLSGVGLELSRWNRVTLRLLVGAKPG